MKNADEVIVSSTSAEVTPVIKLDGEPINDGKVGPITRQLQEGFEKVYRVTQYLKFFHHIFRLNYLNLSTFVSELCYNLKRSLKVLFRKHILVKSAILFLIFS